MVSLCIKLYTKNFRNIKQLKTSIRLFTSYLLTSTGLSSSSWMCAPQVGSPTTCTATEESPAQ